MEERIDMLEKRLNEIEKNQSGLYATVGQVAATQTEQRQQIQNLSTSVNLIMSDHLAHINETLKGVSVDISWIKKSLESKQNHTWMIFAASIGSVISLIVAALGITLKK